MSKLFLLTSIFYLNFLSRIILSPLLPELKKDFDLSTGMASRLFLFLSLGYFTSQLTSGMISSRLGHKWTIVISVFLSAFFLVLLSFPFKSILIAIIIFCLGLSTGLYLPSAIATITSLFSKDFWGRAVSIHELAPNLAFITAPIIASFFIENSSWTHLIFYLSICLALIGVIFSSLNIGKFKGTSPSLNTCIPYLKQKQFWLMLLLFGLGITSTLGIYNMLPIFLVSEHQFSESSANYLVSSSRVATLFTAVLGGFLSDRFGPKRVMGWVLFFTGIITGFLSFTEGLILKIVVFLQPLLAVAFFPAAFSALSKIADKKDRNLIISMIIPFAYVMGGGIMPSIIGLMADFDLFKQGFLIAGAVLASGMIICNYLKN